MGFEVIPFMGIKCKTYELRMLLGWLVGSVFTGYAVYITNFFLPLNAFHAVLYIFFEFFVAFRMRKLSSRPKQTDLLNPWLLFVVLFVSGVSLKYLSAIYRDIPFKVPFAFQSFLDDELSFIHSVLHARRTHLLFYSDPRMSGKFYRGYSSPLLYMSLLMSLGASYSDASILVCFLNTVACVYCIFLQSQKFTVWPWFATLLVVFNGSSATYLYFFNDDARMDIRNDLVHRITSQHETMAHQFLFSLMSFSKSSSVAIAITQYAVYFWSGPLAAIIPSASASFGVFLTMVSLRLVRSEVWPYCLSLVFKVFPFSFSFWPLFREEMMRGTFCSSVTIWGDVFGSLAFLALANCAMLLSRSPMVNVLLAGFPPFCVLEFLREGSRYQNVVAVTAFYGASVMISVACGMRAFRSYATSKEGYGGLCYIMWAMFFYLVVGGLICGVRIVESKTLVMDKNADMELVSWIDELVPRRSVLLIEPKILHPAILAGRQIFLGDKRSIWSNGIDLKEKLYDFDVVMSSAGEAWKRFGIEYVVEELGSFELNGTRSLRFNEKWRLSKLQ